MNSRRLFLWRSGALLTLPLVVKAQEGKGRVYRVGCIPGGALGPREHQWAAFRKGMREQGYVEGKNVVLDFRVPAEGVPADDIVADLVRKKTDVIVMTTSLQIQTALRIAGSTPIVMTGTTDPVALGFVASLARPGGSVTGLSLSSAELSGKRLELLRELNPRLTRVGMLWNPNDRGSEKQFTAAQEGGRQIGVEIVSLPAKSAADLAPAFRTALEERANALIVASQGLFYGLRTQVMDLALKARIPSIWPWESFGEFGALLVYGPSDTENYRRAASYVDRILKGARPGDLPIEQPATIHFVVNLKTAKALGITVPNTLLLRADKVIQ